jgi:hypothetical protein
LGGEESDVVRVIVRDPAPDGIRIGKIGDGDVISAVGLIDTIAV